MEHSQVQEHIYSERFNLVDEAGDIKTQKINHVIRVDHKVPKLGLMMVGLGGNNGTTLTAGILANKKKLSWINRQGKQTANFYGSLTQSSVTKVGIKFNPVTNHTQDVFKVVKDLVPLVNPTDILISGWDISDMDLYNASYRAQVLEPSLIEQLPELKEIKPLSAVLNPNYVATNQSDRISNLFRGNNLECVNKIRKDIKEFAKTVEKVVVLWTANTEKMYPTDLKTSEQLDALINDNEPVPASILYAYACALERVVFLNGSPQNCLHCPI